MSQDKRKGPGANSNLPSQRPIKVRQNALRGKVFSARRMSEQEQSPEYGIDGSPYLIQEVEAPRHDEGGSLPEGEEIPIREDHDDDEEEDIDVQLNIQTIDIDNPSNIALNIPKLPLT